jgi:hypothetical protein
MPLNTRLMRSFIVDNSWFTHTHTHTRCVFFNFLSIWIAQLFKAQTSTHFGQGNCHRRPEDEFKYIKMLRLIRFCRMIKPCRNTLIILFFYFKLSNSAACNLECMSLCWKKLNQSHILVHIFK